MQGHHTLDRFRTQDTGRVMDCPGLLDTSSSDQDVATALLEAVSSMRPGPDVIGYVIRIGRYTEEDFSAYRRLKALLDDVTDHMMVIMTHGDQLKGEDIWNALQQAPLHLQQVLKECGHRVIVFDNTFQHHKKSQVKVLLREARKLKNQNQRCPYILKLEDDAENEAEERLLRMERLETRQKASVRKLVRKKLEAEQSLARQRETWAEDTKKQEESFRTRERSVNEKMKDLSKELDDYKDMNEETKEELEDLNQELEKLQ